MINELLSRVEREWRPALAEAGIRVRLPLDGLKLGGPGKSAVLVFDQTGPQPVLILKLAQSAARRALLTNEYHTLVSLAQNEDIQEAIPRPGGLFEIRSTLVLAESVLPGIPLYASLQKRKRLFPAVVEKDLRTASAFLERLVHATTTTNGTGSFPSPALVREKIERLAGCYENIPWPADYVENLLASVEKCQGLPLIECGRHGDYWPGNFLLSRDGVGVIDWESYFSPAPPLFDIFFFLTTYALHYPWRGWEECPRLEAFRRGFIERNWFSELAQETLAGFFQALGLPSDATRILFDLFLMDMAAPGAIPNDPRWPPQYADWYAYFMEYIHRK